jgi:hypothetical protein
MPPEEGTLSLKWQGSVLAENDQKWAACDVPARASGM